jgi:ATP/maltotriose-dependent transcriptional regulator MalT
MHAALTGEPVERTTELADRSLAGGAALPDSTDPPVFYHACFSFICAEEWGRARQLCSQSIAEAERVGSGPQFAAAAAFRSWASLVQGEVAEAEADARAALSDGLLNTQALFLPLARAVLIESLIERGELEAAGDEIDLPPEDPPSDLLSLMLLCARGRVLVALGRAHEGLAALLVCGRGLEALGATSPAVAAWRSEAALAQLQLGDREEARRLAASEVELARRLGGHRALGVALRVAGLTDGGKRGIAQLREAVSVLEPAGAELEHARALVDLGAALRRAGQRREARGLLEQGLDLAHRCGAPALTDRARTELRATGARPRRLVLTGVESLTPSERRVAELAAQGMTNREVAQALFVTARTVESHLTNAYRKLEIASREELPGALDG